MASPRVVCPRCGVARYTKYAVLCRDCREVLTPQERQFWLTPSKG